MTKHRASNGSVYEIGKNRWRVQVEGRRNPETGKRTRLTKVVNGSRKQAEKAKTELLIKAGMPIDSALTLDEYVNEIYLPAKRSELKLSTYESYEFRFSAYVLPYLGSVRMKDLDAPTIRSWLDTFDKPTIALEAYRVLRRALGFAVYDDHIATNPCDKVRTPRVEEYDPDVLTIDEIRTYLQVFNGSSVEAAVILALGCGFRRGEIAALNVDDIDTVTGAISIDDSYLSLNSGTHEDTPKSESGTRVVHLPQKLLARLVEILPPSGPVMVGKCGRMHPDSITHTYNRRLDKLPEGVQRVPFKNLRHSSLTWAFESGADIEDLKVRGGHSQIQTQSKYYLRPKGIRDARIADTMSSSLDVPNGASSTGFERFEIYQDTLESF